MAGRRPPRTTRTVAAHGAAELPSYNPQLALLVTSPPSGPGWLHELKYDGYRIGVAVKTTNGGRHATLLSRRGLDWTATFPAVAAAAANLPVRSALIDGEVVILLPDGRTDFSALQNATRSHDPRLVYYAFDLLSLDGESLLSVPLSERKARLATLLAHHSDGPIRYADHFPGEGIPFFKAACAHRAEGIVSKNSSGVYRPGSRSADWQKSKCVQRQEFVVGGYLSSAAAPLAALHVGHYDEHGSLCFAGKVGTGFQAVEVRLLAGLKSLSLPSCPFSASSRPKGKDFRDALWVQPTMVVEVEFLEWTPDLHIRHPSFKGVREDKDARSVRAERPAAAGGGGAVATASRPRIPTRRR